MTSQITWISIEVCWHDIWFNGFVVFLNQSSQSNPKSDNIIARDLAHHEHNAKNLCDTKSYCKLLKKAVGATKLIVWMCLTFCISFFSQPLFNKALHKEPLPSASSTHLQLSLHSPSQQPYQVLYLRSQVLFRHHHQHMQ